MKKFIYYILLLLTSIQTANAAYIRPFVEFMNWHASESNTSWALTISSSGQVTDVTQSEIDFKTAPAWKVGVSILPDNKFWDTTFYWTHFATRGTNNINLNAQIVSSLFFSGSFFISNDLFFGGSAQWKLQMNMFDLQVSHNFKPTPSITLVPKVGLKGGSINQSINLLWNAIIYTSTENLNNDFTGIGPSFGLDAKWNFFKELNIVGDVSTALMYGRWNDNDIYQRPSAFFGLITPITITSKNYHSKLGAFMMDYYLGLEWLHQGKVDVTFRLGYEAQYWAGQLRLIAVQQLPTLGDLTIQGATCSLSIGF